MGALIRARPQGATPAAAIRDFVLDNVSAIRGMPSENARGNLGSLAVISPAVNRLALELTDRQARALAEAISDTGRLTHDGHTPAEISDALHPKIANVLTELDGWLAR